MRLLPNRTDPNPDLDRSEVTTEDIFTIPNIISFARLLGVPLFLWLVLVPEEDGWALVVLALSGFSDWLDGYLARKWNQISRVGQLLDPIADRLYIIATVVAFVLRDIIPLWFAAVIIARDVFMACLLPVVQRLGYQALPVHFLGKAATFCLLYAFPLLLLGDGEGTIANLSLVFGWAFALWGVGLYWWASALYVQQILALKKLQRDPSPVPA